MHLDASIIAEALQQASRDVEYVWLESEIYADMENY